MKKIELFLAIVALSLCGYCFVHLNEVYIMRAAYISISSIMGIMGIMFIVDLVIVKWQD